MAVGSKYIPPFKDVSYFFFGNNIFLSKSISVPAVWEFMFNMSPLKADILVCKEVRRAELAEFAPIGTYTGVPYFV